jgi:hypothetical protein
MIEVSPYGPWSMHSVEVLRGKKKLHNLHEHLHYSSAITQVMENQRRRRRQRQSKMTVSRPPML